MNINATLLIQVFNFLVCYRFLSKRFFVKVVAAVEKKAQKERDLLSSIEEIAGNINLLNVKKTDELSAFRKSMDLENLSISSDYLDMNESKVDVSSNPFKGVSSKEEVVNFIVEKCSTT